MKKLTTITTLSTLIFCSPLWGMYDEQENSSIEESQSSRSKAIKKSQSSSFEESDLSEYSDETLKAASAVNDFEEEDSGEGSLSLEFIDVLEKATRGKHTYSLSVYGKYLISEVNLRKKSQEDRLNDIKKSLRFYIMAHFKGDGYATDVVNELAPGLLGRFTDNRSDAKEFYNWIKPGKESDIPRSLEEAIEDASKTLAANLQEAWKVHDEKELLRKISEACIPKEMSKYAFVLLDADHLLESKQIEEDILSAADLMLRAAWDKEEKAEQYVAKLNKRVKKITAEGGRSVELLDVAKRAKKADIKKWREGKDKNPSNEIRDAVNLFFLSVLPKLEERVVTEFEKRTAEEILAISSQKAGKLKGKKVVHIHAYASETLGLGNKISETPSKSHSYYDTRHKYPEALDMSFRTLNCAMEGKLLEGKDDFRLIKAQPDPMKKGPVYDGLRWWEPNGREPKRLPRATAFVVDSFYTDVSKIFYGHPSWLVEMSHMEKPWKEINKIVKKKYEGKWPKTPKGPYNKDEPETQRRAELKTTYMKKTEEYISSGESKKSIAYRLFLSGMMDRMNKSIIIDQNYVEIDLRYISQDRLKKHNQEISEAQKLILRYASNDDRDWLKNIIDTLKYNITHIQYSIDERYKHTMFEKFIESLKKKGFEIERINEEKKIPIKSQKELKQEKETAVEPQKELKRKVAQQGKGPKRMKKTNLETTSTKKSDERFSVQ